VGSQTGNQEVTLCQQLPASSAWRGSFDGVMTALRLAIPSALALVAFASAAPPASAAFTLPPVGHVFVIVLENKTFADTFGPTGRVDAPYLNNTLVPQGELLTKYYGTGHNSADNYIAMVAGQPPTPASKDDCPGDMPKPVADSATGPFDIATSDGCDYPARFRTLGDQMTDRGLTWKGYNSGIPGPCSMAHDKGHYARKHNPWVFFRSVRESNQCQQDVVGLDQLSTDLMSADTTPNLSYIVPDQCEDAHDNCTGPLPSNPIIDDQYALKQADAFLGVWVPRILNSAAFKQDGLLVINFDESVGDATACCGEQPGPADPAPGGYADGVPGPGGGITGALLISPFISPGSAQPSGLHLNNTDYNHYSLLRSLEDLFGIKQHLGYAAPASVVPFGSDVFDRVPPPPAGGSAIGSGGSGSGGDGGSASGAPPGAEQGGNAPAQGVLGERQSSPCVAAPRSVFRAVLKRSRLRVNGSSTSACGTSVRVVQVAVALRVRGRCRWLTVAGRAHKASSCGRPFWLLAAGGGNGWRLAIPHVGHGGYLVRVRAIDVAGRREAGRGRVMAVHAR
jgi:phosphatidylinositol-3-phosphatase